MHMQNHHTIGELAKRTGVSIRTLRHYDATGLLKPSHRGDNGYRYYSEADCDRLFEILFYRTQGFGLTEIAALLDKPAMDRSSRLLEQREQVDAHIQRLRRIRAQLDQLIAAQEIQPMNKEERFAVFDRFDPDQYEEEVKQRWSDTDAYQESARRTRRYKKKDWARYQAESDAHLQAMAALLDEGVAADDPRTLDVVEKMRLMIDTWFYPCPRGMFANLGDMYVQDERFTAYFEKIRPGMAQFMRNATAANQDR